VLLLLLPLLQGRLGSNTHPLYLLLLLLHRKLP
jgi:hypothetical protein